MATPTHIRAFNGKTRIATAAYYNDGILQVWPDKKEFETVGAFRELWINSCPVATFQITYKEPMGTANAGPAGPINQKAFGRVVREIEEFFGAEYRGIFTEVNQLAADTVRVKIGENYWDVRRSTNFFGPPHVLKNGHPVAAYDWSPALTAAKWVMMLAILTPNH